MDDERYLAMAKTLFPKLQKRDGLPEGELKTAEKRLGFTLPSPLRAMYRLAGRRRDLHGAHDRLLLPTKLIIVNKALIFYEENQRTAAWGIRVSDLEDDDPPVVHALNEPPYNWEPDHETTSSFFFTQLIWQHVNTEPCATAKGSAKLFATIRDQYEAIPMPGCQWSHLGCWGSGGIVFFALGKEEDSSEIFIGATSQEDLDRAKAIT